MIFKRKKVLTYESKTNQSMLITQRNLQVFTGQNWVKTHLSAILYIMCFKDKLPSHLHVFCTLFLTFIQPSEIKNPLLIN